MISAAFAAAAAWAGISGCFSVEIIPVKVPKPMFWNRPMSPEPIPEGAHDDDEGAFFSFLDALSLSGCLSSVVVSLSLLMAAVFALNSFSIDSYEIRSVAFNSRKRSSSIPILSWLMCFSFSRSKICFFCVAFTVVLDWSPSSSSSMCSLRFPSVKSRAVSGVRMISSSSSESSSSSSPPSSPLSSLSPFFLSMEILVTFCSERTTALRSAVSFLAFSFSISRRALSVIRSVIFLSSASI
mmetsp:Transcript_114138/g.233547  ORF Transcript_114138/g.233547 Transcript_114138/m.233547 type:complete len:240 (-) Transcript_114138:44-763(-)